MKNASRISEVQLKAADLRENPLKSRNHSIEIGALQAPLIFLHFASMAHFGGAAKAFPPVHHQRARREPLFNNSLGASSADHELTFKLDQSTGAGQFTVIEGGQR